MVELTLWDISSSLRWRGRKSTELTVSRDLGSHAAFDRNSLTMRAKHITVLGFLIFKIVLTLKGLMFQGGCNNWAYINCFVNIQSYRNLSHYGENEGLSTTIKK